MPQPRAQVGKAGDRNRTKVFEILSRGSADSYAMREHGACMTSGDYPDDRFPTTYSLKGLRHALDLAERTGGDARGAKLVEERFIEAVDKGYGHLYSPVIYRLLEP